MGGCDINAFEQVLVESVMATKSGWTVGYFSDAVRKEVLKLPKPLRAKFDSVRDTILDKGLDELPWDYIKSLRGEKGLWELRLKKSGMIARAIYLQWVGKRVIILVVFNKKSQHIPKHILQLARQRAKEVRNA